MTNQVSDPGSLNEREAKKGAWLTFIAAIVTMLYTGLSPVVSAFVTDFTVDFSPFVDSIDFSKIFAAAFTMASVYFGFTYKSGPAVTK